MMYTAYLHSTKLSRYKVRIKFNKEQNNYLAKIVNAYIVYDLNASRSNPLTIFTLKSCLFGAATIVKNSDKAKWVYRDYGIRFDGKNIWSFGNNYARNVAIFGVDKSLSSHADNGNNIF